MNEEVIDEMEIIRDRRVETNQDQSAENDT